MKNFCSIYPKKICFFMLTHTDARCDEGKHEKLVSFTIYKLSSFNTARLLMFVGLLVGTGTFNIYTHIYTYEMLFQCSSFLLSTKSRHLNIFSSLSHIMCMFYASKRTAALTEHHYIFSYFFYSK